MYNFETHAARHQETGVLQQLDSPHKTKVRVHRYASGALAVFHGPRKLADFNREGKALLQDLKQAA